ncbi:putative alpha-glycosyltransferase/ family 4 [Synechococcus sp. A15-62]|uniref:glycosyltransferase n=1 Tax=Synechococcus sp. A15-62 TaxID=1050657 RepID=UPI00164939A7|nr:glycosyltransferase [Synechococcus sp. A15-62]QNJ00603.1 putative alpha-glycosyltransferase/ family 4 [Synechococcus sp. A15-62]
MEYFIVFIGNYLPDKQESMQRVSLLYKEIAEGAGIRCELIRPIDRVGRLRIFFPLINKWLSYVDKYFVFTIELIIYSFWMSRKYNIIYHITDHSNAIYSLCLLGRGKVVTCHDVLAIQSMLGAVPQNPVSFTGRLLQKIILIGLNHSPIIVCVSRNTEIQLRSIISNKMVKIFTVLQPLNYDFSNINGNHALDIIHDIPLLYRDNLSHGFILHVGGNQWYKNRIGVCQIYVALHRLRSQLGQLPIPLILAGTPPSVELLEYINKHIDLPIIFLRTPTNRQINALYSLASLLLFPSISEGFGWPIVEAMACGCPVVTTGREPMSEAGGESAIYINPSDIHGSARILNEILNWSSDRRSNQIKMGYENTKRFSRSDFLQSYLSIYDYSLNHILKN